MGWGRERLMDFCPNNLLPTQASDFTVENLGGHFSLPIRSRGWSSGKLLSRGPQEVTFPES